MFQIFKNKYFDFNCENIPNKNLVVLKVILMRNVKSVLNGSGQKAHKDVVALNAVVLWAAGIGMIFIKVLKTSQLIKDTRGKNFYS